MTSSGDWQRVAKLRPSLRAHILIRPQVYRGERWYLLHDRGTGRSLRLNRSAYAFIARLDGEVSVEEARQDLRTAIGDETPTQDEAIKLLVQLFSIDALRSGLPVDAKAFFQRYQGERRLAWRRAALSLLSLRLPLLDPDRLLQALLPLARPLFGWFGALLWLLVVGLAALLAVANFTELRAALTPDILAPQNLVSLTLLFIAVKAVHELAHGLAVKVWGGEVHEAGIAFLVLVPVPYVDASDAWMFRSKYKRALVGAIGVISELFLAAIALFVWLAVEPGAVRDGAFAVIMIASVSTLLFNGNPLLRFDAYYVLQDLIEIPNLYSRSARYYLYLVQRYLFGLRELDSPRTAPGERPWFLFYGLASFVYRMAVMVAIVLFLAAEYFIVGVALAAWALLAQIVLPLFRGLKFLLVGPALAGARPQALATSGLLLVTATALLFFLPVSLTTRVDGVVWVPEQAEVVAATGGFVKEILASPGSLVSSGTELLRLNNPELETRRQVLHARRRGLQARAAAELLQDRVRSQLTRQDLANVDAELAQLDVRQEGLTLRASSSGTVVYPQAETLAGSYLEKGQLAAYVVNPEKLIVRGVVPQDDIGLVRNRVESVQVRLAERVGEVVEASVLRETPAASAILPSAALGAAAGGELAVSGDDDAGKTVEEKIFQVDLALPSGVSVAGLGERAWVRFDHGREPLAKRWLRDGRRMLLSRLSL
ncbi:MAG: HlyD family efflux transporter periplasmic adaptor subunit [Chromatiales bacterium]|nr:HlyD family efflux transporter periplasmic adaptor subunit [Chromatiales bacterium]